MADAPEVKIELDHEADAAYVTLGDGEVARTVEVTPEVLVDLDEFNVVIGIESLSIDADLPLDVLAEQYHVHSSVIDTLRCIRPSVGGFVGSFALAVSSAPAGAISPSPSRAFAGSMSSRA